MEKRDMSQYTPVKTKSTNSACSISIINTNQNGRRIKLSKSALEMLEKPESVQLALSADTLIMASELDGNPTHFKVSKGNIYSSNLVIELTKHYGLDFTDKTSLSFSCEAELEIDDRMVLFFKML